MIYLVIYLSLVAGAVCTLVAMTVMRRSETHNVGKLGWLALVLLSPPLGLLLFLLFGGRKISAEHERRDCINLPSQAAASCGELGSISKLAQIGIARGLSPPSNANRLQLLDSPQQIHRHLFDVIDSAEHRLLVHSFILIDDQTGRQLIEKLCEKARNGVLVRLMVDGFGSFMFPAEQLQQVIDAGGKACKFKALNQLSRLAYLNFRNHRKLAVADGRRAVLGGANLVEYEVTTTPGEETWIDLSLRIDGPAAREIEAVFASDWKFTTGEALDLPAIDGGGSENGSAPSDSARLQVIPIGPDSPEEIVDDLWLTAINRANERVWIVTPYFVPPPMAVRSLAMTARRGVDVRIIVPAASDMKAADYARVDYFRELEELGVKIFQQPHRVVHAKVLLVDDEVAYVGSANFDMRSFFLNYELIVAIFSSAKIAETASWIEELMENCDQGRKDDTWSRRFLGTAARVVADQL